MTALPPGYQYTGRDRSGGRATERRLNQLLGRVLKLRDAESLAALERCRAMVADDPDPGYAARNLALGALEAAEAVGCTWAKAMTHVLDQYDSAEQAGDDAPIHEGVSP